MLTATWWWWTQNVRSSDWISVTCTLLYKLEWKSGGVRNECEGKCVHLLKGIRRITTDSKRLFTIFWIVWEEIVLNSTVRPLWFGFFWGHQVRALSSIRTLLSQLTLMAFVIAAAESRVVKDTSNSSHYCNSNHIACSCVYSIITSPLSLSSLLDPLPPFLQL